MYPARRHMGVPGRGMVSSRQIGELGCNFPVPRRSSCRTSAKDPFGVARTPLRVPRAVGLVLVGALDEVDAVRPQKQWHESSQPQRLIVKRGPVRPPWCAPSTCRGANSAASTRSCSSARYAVTGSDGHIDALANVVAGIMAVVNRDGQLGRHVPDQRRANTALGTRHPIRLHEEGEPAVHLTEKIPW